MPGAVLSLWRHLSLTWCFWWSQQVTRKCLSLVKPASDSAQTLHPSHMHASKLLHAAPAVATIKGHHPPTHYGFTRSRERLAGWLPAAAHAPAPGAAQSPTSCPRCSRPGLGTCATAHPAPAAKNPCVLRASSLVCVEKVTALQTANALKSALALHCVACCVCCRDRAVVPSRA